jgi:apolipoprotein N-acyltransferase
MDRNSALRPTPVDVVALLSAVLFLVGYGLHPVPPFMWVSMVPLLWAAPRMSARRAAALSTIAGVLGQARFAWYWATDLRMPPVLLAALVLYIGATTACTVLLGRLFLRRGRPLTAALTAALTWVLGEYLLTVIAPHGAWWSIGYSQVAVLPVLQLASLAGVWGISFVLVFTGVAAAGCLAPGTTKAQRVRVCAGLLVMASAVGGYGAWRLSATPGRAAQPVTVAVSVAAQPSDEVPLSSPAGRELVAQYVRQVNQLSAAGAAAVVLPEKAFEADGGNLAELTGPLGAAAVAGHVDVVLGVMLAGAADGYSNVAIVLPANGGSTVAYRKQHLIPGLESDFSAGHELVFVPGSATEGVIICKDLDVPELARRYRHAGATMLLAPAWDFGSDGWLHSRIAVTRGVENGMSIARSGRDGRLTVSDGTGRVLAEQEAREGVAAHVVATASGASTDTLYSALGDWLPKVAIVWLVLAIGYLLRAAAISRSARAAPIRRRLWS